MYVIDAWNFPAESSFWFTLASDYIITPKWSATPLPVSAVNHADSMSASRAQVPCGLLLSSASIRALGNVRFSGGRQEATLGDAISRTQTPDTLANAHTHLYKDTDTFAPNAHTRKCSWECLDDSAWVWMVWGIVTYPNMRPELEYSILASGSSRFCLFRTVIGFKVKQSHGK